MNMELKEKQIPRIKVSSAKVCLDCDELHVEDECPCCLDRQSYPLKKWLIPMRVVEETISKMKELNFKSKDV